MTNKVIGKSLNKLTKKVSGKKTFITAILMAIYALVGGLLGFVEWSQAIELIFEANLVGFLRAGINKVGKDK